MDKNQTYRSVAAFFLTALVIQVFVLKGLHPCKWHDCEQERFSFEGIYMHAEGEEFLSCDICLFHFSPTDLPTDVLRIQLPDIVPKKSQFTFQQCRLAQKLRQANLRGPPPPTS